VKRGKIAKLYDNTIYGSISAVTFLIATAEKMLIQKQKGGYSLKVESDR